MADIVPKGTVGKSSGTALKSNSGLANGTFWTSGKFTLDFRPVLGTVLESASYIACTSRTCVSDFGEVLCTPI